MNEDLNTKTLDQLIKALKASMPKARVGILGAKTARDGQQHKGPAKSVNADRKALEGRWNFNTNAAVGAAHEFGSKTLPQRSFLRVPISEHLEKKMESSGAFDKNALKLVVKQGSLTPWLKKIAVLAEGIVAEAFETGGFGKWPQWKDPNYKNDGGRILVDTRQLAESITSEVR